MMKNRRILSLLLLFLLVTALLAGCKKTYTVDTENHTISDGEHTYTYLDCPSEKDGEFHRTIIITYPNQSWYYHYYTRYADGTETSSCETTKGYGYGGYPAGELLVEAIDPSLIVEKPRENYFNTGEKGEKRDFEFMPKLFFAGLGMAIAGLALYLRPHDFWWSEHGWAYKNAEPSDRAIGGYMAGGISMCVFGVILVICSFFG